jgi:hypothetical protein
VFLGAGVVPLAMFAYGCGDGSPSIGIVPYLGEAGSSADTSIGIAPATFDSGAPETSIGIDPAMNFDAASDAPPAEDGGDAGADASTSDAGTTTGDTDASKTEEGGA